LRFLKYNSKAVLMRIVAVADAAATRTGESGGFGAGVEVGCFLVVIV